MKRFLAYLMLLALLVTCMLPASAFAKARQMNKDVPEWNEQSVRQYMTDYIAGKDMSRLYGYYDLQIRRYMPLSAYEAFLTDLEWITGDFVGLGSYSSFSEPELQLKTHVLHLCMELQDLDLYFTHKDKEDDWEVMAVQFVPAEKQVYLDGNFLVDSPEDDDYVETEITIGSGATELKGLLTMPNDIAAGQTVPACVLVHDQGALDMNSTMGATHFFEDLAHTLANMGIASIRYNKRTFTYGEKADMTAQDEVIEDALLAGKLLEENASVDKQRIVLIGHGFGAMLAPRIVSESDGLYTGMLLIGGTPLTLAEVMYNEAVKDGSITGDAEQLKATVEGLAKLDETAARELTLFGRNGYYYWEMAQYDPIKIIVDLKLPTYIVQGSQDAFVTEDDGWRLYSEKIGDGITYVSFKSFRGLNHLLMDDITLDENGKPQYETAATLDRSAGRNLSQWILSMNQVVEEE